jgi:serine/threonine protein kinase
LIHRDLKPENIFLARSGDNGNETVKVLDFGIAKLLAGGDTPAATRSGTETGAGILVGTMGYISPEQLLGERPAVSWDLWALAVTVYETLTGTLPFPAANRDKWRQSVLAGDHTPLSEHLADPPVLWEEFFARSLAADRARRPRSAAEFLQHLEQALA